MSDPKKGEKLQDFISRFMSSEEAQEDYPDQKQRLAVAYSKWRATGRSAPRRKTLKRYKG